MLLLKALEFAKVLIKTKVRFREKKAILGNVEIQLDFIIGADGVRSEVARTFGFERPEFYSTIQVGARFEVMDENFVEIYLGKCCDYAIPIAETAKIE